VFEKLESHTKILVSGPQRSGTRICSVMIAADFGLERIDEIQVPQLFEPGQELEHVTALVEERDGFVLHCPTFSRWLHEVSGVAVVLTQRAIADIIKSERRINWRKGRQEIEYARYGYWRWRKTKGLERTFKPISQIKYEFWESTQKKAIENYLEIEYESLSKHSLWVPPQDRKNFGWNQYKS